MCFLLCDLVLEHLQEQLKVSFYFGTLNVLLKIIRGVSLGLRESCDLELHLGKARTVVLAPSRTSISNLKRSDRFPPNTIKRLRNKQQQKTQKSNNLLVSLFEPLFSGHKC